MNKNYSLLILFFALLHVVKAQPANDNCLNAVSLNINSICIGTSGSIAGAADSGIIGCHGTANDDVWYKFTAINTAVTITVVTDGFDPVFELFGGTCSSTSIFCRNNNTTTDESVNLINMIIGRVYYIRVFNFDEIPTSTPGFTICISSSSAGPTPSNDNCSNAIQLSVNSTCITTSGTIYGATDSGVPECTGIPNDDVWYKFIATSTFATITVNTGGFDAVLEVFNSGCSGTELICKDASSGSSETASLSNLTIGSVYYFRIYNYFSTTSSLLTFNVCVTSSGSSAPLNDNCSNANTVYVNSGCFDTSGTISGATNSGVTACSGTSNDDVWYKFVATKSSVIISLSNAGFNPVVQVFSGGCTGTSLVCGDNTTGTSETVNLYNLTVGNTYYLRVYSFNSTTVSSPGFNICIIENSDQNNYGTTISETYTYECNYRIKSPNFPNNYQSNTDIEQVFTPVSSDKKIKITFRNFNTEAGSDIVFIYDGKSSSSPLLGTFSGNSIPPVLTATNYSGALTIRFTTDGSVAHSGWYADISCVDPPAKSNMDSTPLTTCEAYLSSPNYPNFYGYNTNSTKVISPGTEGGKLSVIFNDFLTESNNDYLQIFDGNNTNAPLLATLTGSITNSPIYTASNPAGQLTLKFITNSSTNMTGWSANVICVVAGTVDKAASKFISIYPNPATDMLNVEGENFGGGQYRFRLINMLGEVVYEKNEPVHHNGLRTTISTKNLPFGVYILSIFDGERSFDEKVIIQ